LKITDVEAIVLRQAVVDDGIADGSQDDLVVRIHTDEGITGIGEVDSSPELVAAVVRARGSHAVASGLRDLLVGEDPLDVERLWDRMYRGTIYFGRRGIAIHAISGVDIALWDLKGKALGLPVSALLGTPLRDRVRAYASRLMPNTTAEVAAAVDELRGAGFTAVKLGWGPLGADPDHDIALAEAAVSAGGPGFAVMIDAGLGYVADAATAIRRAPTRRSGSAGFRGTIRARRVRGLRGARRQRGPADRRGRAGRYPLGLPRAHRPRSRRPRPTRRPAPAGSLRRCGSRAGLRSRRGDCPHAWKSGIIKAASLHVNAVLPDGTFQEYCVADTPINTRLTVQRLPIGPDGCVAVPTAPGLGVDLDEDVLDDLRVDP
jgi:L-alanine-DL-glutamate epimerase-like enolase superfamily enzyme